MVDTLISEGYPVQLAVLSDANATDFVGRTAAPIFRDPSPGRTAWAQMEPGAVKHDTFVFSKAGIRTLFWDASASQFSALSGDLRAAVEALGR